METRKIGRDAATGKFKSVKDARKDKKGSVVETMKITSASKVDREGGVGKFTRTVHSASKKGTLSLSVIRKSVAKVIGSRKK